MNREAHDQCARGAENQIVNTFRLSFPLEPELVDTETTFI